jgi:hypothetical protein
MAENYQVKQGDCIYSIAFENGFFADTIWNHPNNKEIKELRKDPSVLLLGDKVHIPDKRPKEVSGSTNEVHKFKVKNTPKNLRIQFKYLDTPVKDEEYKLMVDGTEITGKTDSEGWLRHSIPPNSKRATLQFGDGSEYEIDLGFLDPVDSLRGVKQRLKGLGIFDGKIDDQQSADLELALKLFQFANDIEPTGQPDETTKQKLKQMIGK